MFRVEIQKHSLWQEKTKGRETEMARFEQTWVVRFKDIGAVVLNDADKFTMERAIEIRDYILVAWCWLKKL